MVVAQPRPLDRYQHRTLDGLMHSYTLELASLQPATETMFGSHSGYAIFGVTDGVQFSCSKADWLKMGKPTTVSVMVHAVREEVLDG